MSLLIIIALISRALAHPDLVSCGNSAVWVLTFHRREAAVRGRQGVPGRHIGAR